MEVVQVFDGSRTSITSVVFPTDSVPGIALPHVIIRNSPDSIAGKMEGIYFEQQVTQWSCKQ